MRHRTALSVFGANTRLVHSGHHPHDYFGFVSPPIVRASTVLFPDAKTMLDGSHPYYYGTHGTPTTDALCRAINDLEGAAKTVLVPSGLAAVTIPLLGALKSGDHVLITDSVYFPTRRFADGMLRNLGIHVEYYDPCIGEGIAALLRENTKVVFTESPGSNTFEMQDIPEIADLAHQAGAIVMMDNTWATPLYFRPLEHGVDISIQAATKYPAGHADVLMGFISANERCADLIEQAHLVTGMSVCGEDAWLVLRSLRSMGVRLAHQAKTALALAQWLSTCPQVAQVLHPALADHPGHALWQRDFSGAASLFSIVLNGGDTAQAHAFLNALNLFGMGYSWGGYESLAVPVDLSDRTLAKNNYPGPLLRLQIGLEDQEDLQRDLQQALQATGL